MTVRSLLLRVLRSWRDPVAPTFEQFVHELALLGLEGAYLTAESYAAALAKYLRTPIRIETITNHVSLNPASLEARSLRRELAVTGHMGATKLLTREGELSYLILYLDDLDWWLREHTLFHELGHIAAGHFREMPSVPARTRRLVSRLADRPPVKDPDLREDEADLRANYALLASSLGELSLRKQSFTSLS